MKARSAKPLPTSITTDPFRSSASRRLRAHRRSLFLFVLRLATQSGPWRHAIRPHDTPRQRPPGPASFIPAFCRHSIQPGTTPDGTPSHRATDGCVATRSLRQPKCRGQINMFTRVLIVDDQPRARRSLKALLTAIRWSTPDRAGHPTLASFYPLEVVGEAEDGPQAMLQVQTLLPQTSWSWICNHTRCPLLSHGRTAWRRSKPSRAAGRRSGSWF
jgi:hypothetical protein